MTDAARKADTSMGFMRPNIGQSPRDADYRSPHAVSVRGRPVSEDEELGVLWQMRPASAHQAKLKACDRAADVVNLRRAKGQHESAAAYAAPMEAALAARPCEHAELREGLTDADEDRLEALYRANPCAETARPLLRKRADYRAASLDHDLTIAALHGLTL